MRTLKLMPGETMKTTCDVCGWPGVGNGIGWFGNVHVDPGVCRENLARRARELDEREAELAQVPA